MIIVVAIIIGICAILTLTFAACIAICKAGKAMENEDKIG